MKKLLLLNDPTTKIKLNQKYIEIFTKENSFVIAFKFIKAIYINQHIKIPIPILVKLSFKAPLFLIDNNGTLLAQITKVQDETI